jgi:transposase-like protein
MSHSSQHNPDRVRAFDEPRFSGFERSADSEPSPASSEKPKRARRVFTAADKLRILQEAASSSKRGEIEALLRREAIYSSHLAAWRKQLALRGTEGLEGAKPGRKPKLDARDHRILELERRVQFLEHELERVTGNTEHAEQSASLAVTVGEAC